MGEVVEMKLDRPVFRRRRRDSDEGEWGVVALFTGVRIERWEEPDRRTPRADPDLPPRRRRRPK